MNYIAVRGQGDPNTENSEYKASIGLLYGIAFTIKMSKDVYKRQVPQCSIEKEEAILDALKHFKMLYY